MTIFNDRVVFSSLDNDVLIEFNMPGNEMSRWWCDEIEGWKNTADLNVALNTFGTADGAYPANRFPAKERYLTIQGACQSSSREISESQMDYLVSACKAGKDFYVERYEPTPKRMKVRLASSIEFPQQFEQEFRWLMTLVVPSATKESLVEHSGYVNTYAGGLVYREWTGQVDGDTNFTPNSSFEVDVTTGTFTFNGATVATSTLAPVAAGTRHARVTTSATANSGIAMKTPPWTPNGMPVSTWNGTLSLRGNAGGEVVDTWLRFWYTDGTFEDPPGRTSRTLTTTYQAFTHTADPDETKDLDYVELHARAPGTTAGLIYFVDKVHINAGPAPTPYVNGGATTSSFFAGASNITISSTQAFPKSPGKRSWTNYTRTWSQGSLVGEGFVEIASLDNSGTAFSFPVTTVTGPLYNGAWELVNETTGERLSFRVDIPTGSSLVIDHGARTAIMNGQHLEFRKDGTWWGLAPGANQVRLIADEFNEAATATFVYRDAWRN